MFQTIITSNSTTYYGTANASDNARTYRVGPGVQYSVSKGKVCFGGRKMKKMNGK